MPTRLALTAALLAATALPASAQQQAAAAAGAIGSFRTVSLGMPADAAKAALNKLGPTVALGTSVKVDEILRTQVGGIDGGKGRLWVDISGGKVVNISVVRLYEEMDKAACQAKFDEKAREITAQFGPFAQPPRWTDSQELYVSASRTRARIARDGRALDVAATHAKGGAPAGLTPAKRHMLQCTVSVETRDLAWEAQRMAASGMPGVR